MIAWLVAAAAASTDVPARFAPPLDRAFRVVFHQERVTAGLTRRYELERRLVFRREGEALIAEMTLVRVWQDDGGDGARRFAAAAGALKGRTLRFHLSADGAVTAIDDEAALWAATLAGIAAAAVPARGRAPAAALAREPATPFAALPIERRRAALASPLASLIDRDEGDRTPGSGAITLPGTPVEGEPLTGTRTVAIGADGRLHIGIRARGGPAGSGSLDRERVVDPASGLVVELRETQTTGRDAAVQVIRQHVTLTPG